MSFLDKMLGREKATKIREHQREVMARDPQIQQCATDLDISYEKAKELFFTPKEKQKPQGMMISWRTKDNTKVVVTYGE